MPFVEYRMGGGLNTKADPSEIPDHQLYRASGCRFDKTGAVSSELGRSFVHKFPKGKIWGIVDGYRSGDVYHYIKSGSSVYEELSNRGVGDANIWIGTYLTGASYDAYTYLTDGGIGLKRWDGVTLEDAGLSAPTTAVTAAAATGTGGDMYAGTYKYYVTFYNGVAESNFSPVATVTIEESDDGVSLSDIPTGGSTVTARRLYRTDINGSAKYFLAEIADNTTTTYTDTQSLAPGADEEATPGDTPVDKKNTTPQITYRNMPGYDPTAALEGYFDQLQRESKPGDSSEVQQVIMSNLGALADWIDHDPPPSDIKGLVFHQEQFFGISGTDIVFSRVGEPEHWPAFNRFRPGRRSAEIPKAILPLDSDLLIYTDSNVYRLSSSSGGFRPENVRLETLDSPTGIASENAVTQVSIAGAAVHILATPTGIYMCDGRQVVEVGYSVEGLFLGTHEEYQVQPDGWGTITMASQRDRVWMSYNDGGMTLYMDFQNPQDPQFSVLLYGYSYIHRDQLRGRVYAGDSGGNLWEIPTLDAFNTVRWAVRTKDFVFGEGLRSVAFSEVVFDADLGGAPTNVIVRTDTGRTAVTRLTATLGRRRWRLNLPAHMRGHSVSLELSSSTHFHRHLYSVGFNVVSESEP